MLLSTAATSLIFNKEMQAVRFSFVIMTSKTKFHLKMLHEFLLFLLVLSSLFGFEFSTTFLCFREELLNEHINVLLVFHV